MVMTTRYVEPRLVITTRTPYQVKRAVHAAAEGLGMSVTEYVAKILAETHDLPQFAPPAHKRPRVLTGGDAKQKQPA